AEMKAVKDGDGYKLSGTKMFVQYANSVDYFVVSARTSGDNLSEEGISLFLVDAKSSGITMDAIQVVARDKQYEVIFKDVKVDGNALIGEVDKGFEILTKVIKIGAVAKSGEMVGGGQFVIDLTVNYSIDREQFGKPIGKFQAIQHHCANMLMDLSGSRYMAYKAAWFIDEKNTNELFIASAKGFASDAYRRICKNGHQVGGGSAFMEEQEMQLYSRRAKAGEVMYGDATYHRKMAAKAIGL
ncbi:acyl-CoA dehydrogenase family protein, partial [Spirochaetota bacterium]